MSKQLPIRRPDHAQQQGSADQHQHYASYGGPPSDMDLRHCQVPSRPGSCILMLYETPPRTLPCVCIVGHALDPTGSIWRHALTAEDRNRPPADGAGRELALGGSWPRPERKPSAHAMSASLSRHSSRAILLHFAFLWRSVRLWQIASQGARSSLRGRHLAPRDGFRRMG
jgi:hypothetical protein